MNREKEIIETANKFYKGDEISLFVVAAKWADNTLTDKALKWFDEHIIWANDYGVIFDFYTAKELINSFKESLK